MHEGQTFVGIDTIFPKVHFKLYPLAQKKNSNSILPQILEATEQNTSRCCTYRTRRLDGDLSKVDVGINGEGPMPNCEWERERNK